MNPQSSCGTEKILVVAPSWLGDMVMSQVLIQQLLESSPQAQIHVLAPSATLAIATRMPGVVAAIPSPFAHGKLNLRGRFALAKQIKRQGFDQAIILPNSFKSALIPWRAGINKRTAWRGEHRYGLVNDLRVLDKTAIPLMVNRFYALAFPFTRKYLHTDKHPRLTTDVENLKKLRAKFLLDADKTIVALCPGAEYGPSKQWPAGHFSSLALACMNAGYGVWILGSKGDSAISEDIMAGMDADSSAQIVNLTGKTSLEDVVDLLRAADIVVSNDSGLMHVTCAVDTPVVCVYGSTTPEFTPPLSKRARILQTSISCRPCFKRECPLGHLQCLTNLSPGLVMESLDSLLTEDKC